MPLIPTGAHVCSCMLVTKLVHKGPVQGGSHCRNERASLKGIASVRRVASIGASTNTAAAEIYLWTPQVLKLSHSPKISPDSDSPCHGRPPSVAPNPAGKRLRSSLGVQFPELPKQSPLLVLQHKCLLYFLYKTSTHRRMPNSLSSCSMPDMGK